MTELSLGFDIVIMALLVATIYYAIKLSRHLDSFRSNRSDMEQLIRELSKQITRAQEGITVLDDLASTKGDELRKYIARAQGLSDELQIITGSADALAERLEQLGTRNRSIVDTMERTAVDLVYPGGAKKSEIEPDINSNLKAVRPARYEDTLAKAEKKKEDNGGAFFSIRDADFDEDDADSMDSDDGLLSQAERDLADALKRRGQKT
ncbi:MAG: DUF6468 domain-containing protein [Pseudomonadota bacterium]